MLRQRIGNLVRTADRELTFSVSGPGALQAFGNSDPKSEEMFVGSSENL